MTEVENAPERDPDPIVMYIVVRKSLKLVSGKVGAQCGHAVQYLCQEVIPERWPSKEKTDLLGRHLAKTITPEGQMRLDALKKEDDERYKRHEVTREWLKSPAHARSFSLRPMMSSCSCGPRTSTTSW